MTELIKKVFEKYGLVSLFAVLILGVVVWFVAHSNAEPGSKVSILWGLVEYNKKQSESTNFTTAINHKSTDKSESVTKKDEKNILESDPLFPKLVGANVEFPSNILEKTTPGYESGNKFYIAVHENGWNPQSGDKEYEMERIGDKLIAKNVINKRFHPVLVPRVWQRIEQAYDRYLPPKGKMANNIDYTNPNGPCYCFGPDCISYKDGGK